MGSPFTGEIRLFGGTFAPIDWALCNGALQSIAQNDVLFQLLGTTYGGDGVNTFALPDLQGRVPIHQGTLSGTGQTFVMGQRAGEESVQLNISQLPNHSHSLFVSTNTAAASTPINNVPGAPPAITLYKVAAPTSALGPTAIGTTGNNLPHVNLQPSLCVTFIICLFGIFPSQN